MSNPAALLAQLETIVSSEKVNEAQADKLVTELKVCYLAYYPNKRYSFGQIQLIFCKNQLTKILKFSML